MRTARCWGLRSGRRKTRGLERPSLGAWPSLQIQRPTALSLPAVAADDLAFAREFVINCQFFAGLDPAPAAIIDVPLIDRGVEIGFAAMVDVFGAASAHRAVEYPAIVHVKQIKQRLAARLDGLQESSPGLAPGDALTRVLDHFALRGNRLGGKHAKAMNPGTVQAQAKAGESLVNLRPRLLLRFHRPHVAAFSG